MAPPLAPCSFYSLLFPFCSLFLWHVLIPLEDTKFLVTMTNYNFSFSLTSDSHPHIPRISVCSMPHLKFSSLPSSFSLLVFLIPAFLFLNVTSSITVIWSTSSRCLVSASVFTLSFQCLDIIWFLFLTGGLLKFSSLLLPELYKNFALFRFINFSSTFVFIKPFCFLKIQQEAKALCCSHLSLFPGYMHRAKTLHLHSVEFALEVTFILHLSVFHHHCLCF